MSEYRQRGEPFAGPRASISAARHRGPDPASNESDIDSSNMDEVSLHDMKYSELCEYVL